MSFWLGGAKNKLPNFEDVMHIWWHIAKIKIELQVFCIYTFSGIKHFILMCHPRCAALEKINSTGNGKEKEFYCIIMDTASIKMWFNVLDLIAFNFITCHQILLQMVLLDDNHHQHWLFLFRKKRNNIWLYPSLLMNKDPNLMESNSIITSMAFDFAVFCITNTQKNIFGQIPMSGIAIKINVILIEYSLRLHSLLQVSQPLIYCLQSVQLILTA